MRTPALPPGTASHAAATSAPRERKVVQAPHPRRKPAVTRTPFLQHCVVPALLAATFGVAGCGEQPQTLGAADPSWKGSVQPGFNAPGWKASDQAAWDAQLRARAQNQNEYLRTGQR